MKKRRRLVSGSINETGYLWYLSWYYNWSSDTRLYQSLVWISSCRYTNKFSMDMELLYGNQTMTQKMRLFQLHREVDASGVSGTGIVAEGAEFTNGTCVLVWLTEVTSTGIYPNIKNIETIHGHEGRTRVVFLGENP